MATLNKVMLIGRLTADPEAPRTLPNSGATVVKFRFAVGRSKKNPQTGQWENDPNPLYIDCEVFASQNSTRDLTKLVSQYVKQGDQLYIEGRLQLDQWDDKTDGSKRSKHKVVVTEIQMLGSKGDGQGGGGQGQGRPQQPQRQPQRGGGYPPPDDGGYGDGPDGDIPF